MLTEHAPATSVQLPPGVKVTVPVGVLAGVVVSATVAVHVVAWLIAMVDGLHATVVVVVSRVVTVTVPEPLLPLWTVSPPYVPVIVAVPTALGVNVTEHEPAVNVQLSGLTEPEPVTVKLTLPVGVLAVPSDVSATVAVHVLVPEVVIVAGEHATVVLVVLRLTVIEPVPVLVRCVESPP